MRVASQIRVAVFVDEQGVPIEEEIDEHDLVDPDAVHALARDGARALGTGRFYARDRRTVQIGRMAVARDARGRGYGREILAALLAEATRRGYVRAHLHAQLHARAFYLDAGFFDDGDLLWDGGIEHRPMSKTLERSGLPPTS